MREAGLLGEQIVSQTITVADNDTKSFLETWKQDKAAIGIDNVIKLFSK